MQNIEDTTITEANQFQPAVVSGGQTINSERTALSKVVKWTIYVGVFLAPLFFLPFTSDALGLPKQFLFFIIASVALILWMVDVLQAGTLKIKWTLMDWLIVGFVGSVLLSSVLSENIYKSIFGSLGSGSNSLVAILSLAVFYFVVVNSFDKKDAKKLLEVFMLSVLLTVGLAIFQSFGIHLLPFEATNSRDFNTVGSLNSISILASIGLILALGSFVYKKLFSLRSLVPLLTIIFSFILLLIANWWVLWVITIAGLIINFGVLALKRGYKIKDSVIAGVIIGLILLVMISNFRLGVRDQLPLEVSVSYKTSLGIAGKSLLEKPIWGFGLENFSLAYDKFKFKSINDTPFWTFRFSDSTSEFLNKVVEEGVVGLAFGLLLFAGVIGIFISRVKGKIEDYGDISIFPAFFALFVAFILYPFNLTLYFALFFILAIFVVMGGYENVQFFKKLGENKLLSNRKVVLNVEESSFASMVTSIAFTLVIILIIVGGYFLNQQLRANILFAKTARLDEKVNSDEIINNLNKVIAINPKEDVYYRNFVNFLVNRAADEARNTEDKPEDVAIRVQALTATAVNVSKALTDMHPNDSLNWLTRGFVYQNLLNLIRGSDAWAIKSYNEFQNLAPASPLGYSRIGNIYMANADSVEIGLNNQSLTPEERQALLNQYDGDLVKAEESFKKAIELKQDFAAALYNLGVVYDRQGRLKEAIEQLKATSQATPNQAGLAFELGLLYLRDNNKDGALVELQRAVALFNDYSNARWFLGMLYEERGELDKAIGQIQRVLELNPGDITVKEKLENLLAGKREIPPAKVIEQSPIEENIGEQ